MVECEVAKSVSSPSPSYFHEFTKRWVQIACLNGFSIDSVLKRYHGEGHAFGYILISLDSCLRFS